jgi:hypothetical protein
VDVYVWISNEVCHVCWCCLLMSILTVTNIAGATFSRVFCVQKEAECRSR